MKRPVLLVLLALGAGPVAAQTHTRIDLLADLLAAEDARSYHDTLLHRAAATPDPLVRKHAALAAGRIGDVRGGPLLTSLLDDRNSSVRASAAFAIGLLRDSSLSGALVSRLQRPPLDSATAAEIVGSLAKVGGQRASGVIARILDREYGAVGEGREAAVAAALLESWRLAANQPVAALRRYALERDPALRRRAVYSLARMRAPEAAEELLATASDSDPVVRMYAVRALGRRYAAQAGLDSHEVVQTLLTATSDPEPGVRVGALLALGTWADSTLAPAAVARLQDSVANVRVQAATALGQLGGSRATLALAAAHGHAAVWAVRREALVALARADTAVFRLASEPWRRSDDWRERAAAAEGWALAARVGTPAWQNDPDGRVVAAGLQAWFGEADSSDAALLAAARPLLDHRDGGVRSVAADAIGRAPATGDIPALVRAYSAAAGDSFPEAAQSALAALVAVAARDDSSAALVRAAFLDRVEPPSSYLLRRWATEHWPEAAARWGPAAPIATGRARSHYRTLVRRWLVGAGHRPRVRIATAELGSFDVELLGNEAPLTVDHFLDIVSRGLLDGGRWHRVVPNFVVQDGDPRGDGWGGPPVQGTPVHAWAIRDELNRIRYEGPVIGMALSGPDTGNSQWFVNLSPQPHLDGTYTVFGRVIRRGGLDRITQGDSIVSIRQLSPR
ncbi:MAG TPA: HEAT repeat domain-containing protein [Gemmatimonadales bacterium]|nr:HEAT repeat domain-containing protein [Gemmatimonadales bacterium]